MKKLLLIAALLLLPLFASAQDAATLLTDDGTLYAVAPRASEAGSNVHLVLTTRSGESIRSQAVPATLDEGTHGDAAMAYDPQSKTLFVFWLRQTGMLNSQLLVSSLDAKGVWSEAIAFGNPFDYRENLRIAVTRKVVVANDKLENGLTVHAAWWETDTHTGNEGARYAVLGVENGVLSEPAFLDLTDTIEQAGIGDVSPDQLAVLRHPMLTPSAKQESVLVTFGDLTGGKLHRTRVYPVRPPVADGRIRIPVGRADSSIDAPRFHAGANSTVEELHGDNGNLALYIRDGGRLRYVLLRGEEWSDTRTIVLDEQVTAPAAIEAIRRLVNEH